MRWWSVGNEPDLYPRGYDPPGLLHATHAIADPLVVPARAAVLVHRDR